MEAALVSVATGVLKPVLGKLGALLSEKYNRFKRVRKDIKSLTDELAAMDAFLMKMSEEEDPDVQDKVWMNEVRELSYDMEDCIDDFMQSVDDKDPEPEGFIEKIKHSLGKLGKMKARRRIANEIHDLKKQITEVGEKNARYKTEVGKRNARHKTVEAFSETIDGTIDTRALVIFDDVSKIVGMDESKTEVINLLTEEYGRGSSRQLKVVSIFGPGGMGKTTLANQVYQELRRGFVCQAFLSVSRSPSIMNILRTIFSKVSNRPYAGTEEGSVQQLAINIYEFLQDKRYTYHPYAFFWIR
uniref:Disease resistance protein RPP13 n=1 Tax=Aegilops tauschii subsp. strangulata TaxID=200361 RepID=A0A453MM05_AEGTS